MDADEVFARKLQQEFDEESKLREKRSEEDGVMAQRLALSSHDISDDEEEDVELLEKSFSTSKKETDYNSDYDADTDVEDDLKNSKGSEKMNDNIGTLSVDSPSTSFNSSRNESSEQTKSKDGKVNAKRPACSYGSKCYRNNPKHLAEFYHPGSSDEEDKPLTPKNKKQKLLSPDEKKTKPSSPQEKKPKTPKIQNSKMISSDSETNLFSEKYKLPFRDRLKMSEPFNIFLNKSFTVKETQKDWQTLVFPDLLNPKLGTLIESCQINFMVDLEMIMEFYTALKVGEKPLLVIFGLLEGNVTKYSNVICKIVSMPYQYGVHHSKMMLFHYEEGCRVVVHTANLVPDDWYEKTQGFWVSPLFPPLPNGKASLLDGDSGTRFKHDLVDYLLSYKISNLTRWTQIIKSHDMSSCNAFFVGSVPGYHVGENKLRYGHMKCRSLLKKYSTWAPRVTNPVVVQCSSIVKWSCTLQLVVVHWRLENLSQRSILSKLDLYAYLSRWLNLCHLMYSPVSGVELNSVKNILEFTLTSNSVTENGHKVYDLIY